MLLRDNQKRSLKGFIESQIIASKIIYVISGLILLGNLLLFIIINIILTSTGQQSSSNGGALTTGVGTAAIVMFITAILMAVGKEVKAAFIFPIDRKTYVFGNFIMFVINIIGILLLSSIGFILESVIFKILSVFYENIIYVNSLRLEVYLTGFWISFCYILVITTFTYFVFTLFARYKFIGVIIFILGINLPIIFAKGRVIYAKIFEFFIGEQSIMLLSIKLLIFAILFQFLSYLTMRKLEVIN